MTSPWQERQFNAQVRSGLGVAASFLGSQTVVDAITQLVGFEPWPGTLNLALDAQTTETLSRAFVQQGRVLQPVLPGQCAARFLPLRLDQHLYGCAMRPELPDYDRSQLEILSPVHLRSTLQLEDDDTVQFQMPQALNIKAIAFDLDGTLVDSMTGYQAIADTAAAELGLSVNQELVRQALNRHPRNFWEDVVPGDFPERERAVAQLHRRSIELAPQMISDKAKTFDDAAALLKAISDSHLKLGVVTSSAGQGMRALEAIDCAQHVESVITALDVKNRKPAPEGIARCAEQLGVAPSALLYVGDAIVDVQAARAAGAPSATVLLGAGSSAELAAEGPDRMLSDLASLRALLQFESVLS